MKTLTSIIVISILTTFGSLAQEKPNIIFLLTDDQVSIATGCYGNDQVQTPNMDKMADEGVMFMNHYNTTAICMASRACIMKGMYEYKAATNFDHGPMHKAVFDKSYPVLLQEAGYFTGFAGKFGFAVSEGTRWADKKWDVMPVDRFDMWGGGLGQTSYETVKNDYIKQYADEYPHSSRAYAAWAADFFTVAKQTGKPFCMSISFKAPHLPFTPDVYFDHVYANKKYKKPANYGAENGEHLAPQAKTGRQYNGYGFWRNSEESYQEAIQKYNQLIHGVDYAIGMIREELKSQGLADNTVIIFTGDNGYSCGAHNLAGKVLPYEEASKSPLIIYDPRLPKKKRGAKRETLTANIDMAPTMLTYAGVDVPENMDGENLIPLIEKAKGIDRESITLTNMWGNNEIQAMSVVTKDWKYIYWQYEDEKMKPTEELYNIGDDRLEMKNEATNTKRSKELEQMRGIYDTHYQALADGAVDFNNYTKYKVLFDRESTAAQKAPYYKKAKK